MVSPTQQRCTSVPAVALSSKDIQQHLSTLSAWSLHERGQEIYREFSFKNYYHTMAFVNAVAYIAHQENHHPDLFVSFNRCIVHYTTHDAGGLSLRDFICAAKVDALL